jgi:hypothetical protein
MLSTKNDKLLAFYKTNKHLDFEKMNLIFIDLIEKLNKDLMHTAENSLSNELLKTIFSKVDKIETTQNNMNQNISTILNSVSSIHTIFSEQKNTYIQEIRNSLESIIDNKQLSYNEKIQHILEKNQTATVEKTKILLSDIFSSSNEDLFNKIIINISKHFENLNSVTSQLLKDTSQENIFAKISQIVETKHSSLCNMIDKNIHTFITSNNSSILSEIQNQYQTFSDMNDFLNKQRYCNSSTIGKIGENRLEIILNESFPAENIINTSGVGKCGDFILERKSHQNKKIIFENKEYTTNVPEVEVKKFIRDIEHTKCHGIFLSQNTGIANKKHFEINFHNNFILIYLHKVNYNSDLIASAVQIIDMITQKIDLVNIDTEKISKDTLEDIQKDFMIFLKQKTRLIDMSKKYHKEILHMIEEIGLPSIAKFLSVNFSNTELLNYTCEYCNRCFKNKRALAAHYKGCAKKKNGTNVKIET